MGNRLVAILTTTLLVFGSTTADSAQLCAGSEECMGDDACIGGACVPPVPDLAAYLTGAQARRSSFVWAIQFPALFEPIGEDCCFDFTGNGQPDDALGTLLGTLSALTGIDYNYREWLGIVNGGIVKVLDWRELDSDLLTGDVQVSVFEGTFSGTATWDDRVAGLGHTLLANASFGSHGALDQLNAGSVLSGQVDVVGDGFSLEVPFIIPRDLTPIRLLEPRLQAPVAIDETSGAVCQGLCTEDEDRGVSHTPQIVGGGLLGGIVPIEEFLGRMDSFYRECSCAGVDSSSPVISFGENLPGMTYNVACTANIGNPDLCDEVDPCFDLASVCGAIVVIPLFLDIDYDQTGVNESLSVGLRIGWSGNALDGLTHLFLDGFESGDTSVWSVSAP